MTTANDSEPVEPTIEDTLSNCILAADASAQAVVGIWTRMTNQEREAWLAEARCSWPRLDAYLPEILLVADRLVETGDPPGDDA